MINCYAVQEQKTKMGKSQEEEGMSCNLKPYYFNILQHEKRLRNRPRKCSFLSLVSTLHKNRA